MKRGDFVIIGYIGRLENGEIFDLTDEETARKEKIHNPKFRYRPIPVIVGAGFVIPGLDKALLEMNVNEKKKVEIQPEDAFGKRDPSMVKVLPESVFKEKNLEPKKGMAVDFSGAKGRIQSIAAGRVRVDFNNPLAGRVLNYELEVRERIDDPEKQIKSIFDYFGIEKLDMKIEDKIVILETVILPIEVKNKISSLIIEFVKPNNKNIEKVKFVETFVKKPENK